MNSTSFLPLVAELLVKSTVILLAAALANRAWRRASAAQRHLIWLAAFVALLLLPATRMIAPRWNLAPVTHAEVRVRTTDEPANASELDTAPAADAPRPAAQNQFDWRVLVIGGWLAGSAALLTRRVLGGVRLRWMLRASVAAEAVQFVQARRVAGEFGVTRRIAVHVSRACRVPLTWGAWRPVLMLPTDCTAWPDDQLRAALRHECAHIHRGDFAVRLLADVVRAFYWPNPLVWFASRALRTAQEQACDDLVLQTGTCPTDYATLLCEAARRFTAPHSAVAMAQPSTLETRVLAIVDATCDRRPLTLRAAFLGALAIALTLALSTAAQVRAADPTPVAKEPAPTEPAAKEAAPLAIDQVPQVMIEARFIEITPGYADADALFASLGIAPKSASKLPGGIRVLANAQFQDLTIALNKMKGVDMLSAPRVMTRSRQQAVIEIINEFRYPTSWEKGAAKGEWRPTAHATKNTGVTLETEPEVRADGKIALRLKPQVITFLGFKNLDTGKFSTNSKPDSRYQALFSERTLDTNIVLKAGDTVVLSLKQTGDANPFANKAPKGQLVVFVTASIVLPNGEKAPADK